MSQDDHTTFVSRFFWRLSQHHMCRADIEMAVAKALREGDPKEDEWSRQQAAKLLGHQGRPQGYPTGEFP